MNEVSQIYMHAKSIKPKNTRHTNPTSFMYILTVDGTDLGIITSGDGHTDAGTLSDEGGGVAHVLAIAEGNLRSGQTLGSLNGLGNLIDGDGLSRESSLLTGQVLGLEQTKIAGDLVTKAKDDDVAGNDVDTGDHHLLTVAEDTGIGGKHRLEGLGGLLGVTLLVDTNVGVDGNDGKNDTELDPVRNLVLGTVLDDGTDHRHKGNDDENGNEDVGNLIPDALEESLLLLLGHLVGTVLVEAGLGVGRRQTGRLMIDTQAELLDDGGLVHAMPGGGLGDLAGLGGVLIGHVCRSFRS